MKYKVKELVFKKATDELWKKYFDFDDKMKKDLSPDDSILDRDTRKKLNLDDIPTYTEHNYYVEDSGIIVATCSIEYETPKSESYESNKHFASIWIYVLKEYRRRGIATSINETVKERMQLLPEKKELCYVTVSEDGNKFAENLEGKLVNEYVENRAKIELVDSQVMDKWVGDGSTCLKDNDLQYDIFVGDIPKDYRNAYCEGYCILLKDMPKDDMDYEISFTPNDLDIQEKYFRSAKMEKLTIIINNSKGLMVGMTSVGYYEHNKRLVRQEFTGVKKDYRGLGLGKFLKAKLHFEILERYPDAEFISTENATSNDSMLAINNVMGFYKYKSVNIYNKKMY